MLRASAAAVLLVALLLAGCATEEPAPAPNLVDPGTAATAENDTWGVPDIHDNSSEVPPDEAMPAASPTPAMPEPAPVGEWINGTNLDARLVSVTTRANPENANRTLAKYTWEFAYKATPEAMRIHFRPSPAHQWVGGPTTQETSWEVEVPVAGTYFEAVILRAVFDEQTEEFRWQQPAGLTR